MPYTRFAFDDIFENGFSISRHHTYLVGKLMRMFRGEFNNIIISMPPRHGKSSIIDSACAWQLGRNPYMKIINVGNGVDISRVQSGIIKSIYKSDFHRRIFGDNTLIKDSATDWQTVNGGGVYSAGVKSNIVGRGFDIGIIDDPYKGRLDANSATTRDNIINFYQSEFYTRRTKVEGRRPLIIIVATRWHPNDLSGWLLANQPDIWTEVRLPAISEGYGDPLGRPIGESLWESMYPIEELNLIKESISHYEFEAQYQQNPKPPDGSLFNPENLQYYKDEPLYNKARFWDLATTTGASSDYTVGGLYGFKADRLFLEDINRGKWQYSNTKGIIENQAYKDGHDVTIVIEAEGMQRAIFQDIQSVLQPKGFNVVPYQSDGKGKFVKALKLMNFTDNKKFFIKEADWTQRFVKELCDFSGDDKGHDDQVDTASMAAEYFEKYTSVYPIITGGRKYDNTRIQ